MHIENIVKKKKIQKNRKYRQKLLKNFVKNRKNRDKVYNKIYKTMIPSTSGAFGSAFAFDSDGLGSNPSLVLNFLHMVTNFF
jgi:hypothetical protein